MLEDMQVHPQDQQLPIEEITSPLEAQILQFCESDLFHTPQNPPNSCYHHHSPYLPNNEMTAPPSVPPDIATLFDEDEADISASIDFSTSPSSFSAPNMSCLNMYGGPERWPTSAPVVPLPLSTSNYEEECYVRVGSGVNVGPYLGYMGMHQELEYQGDNGGMFVTDTVMPSLFNCSTQLQGVSEGQHAVHGGGTSSSVNNNSCSSLASEISSSLEDATFKVGKLSVEERKRKIHRYLKKRNERNFSKKIKYECRKTLADSRPRVRGRFAKNDELMMMGNMGTNNEDEIDHDQHLNLFSNSIPHPPRKVLVKDEEEHDSSDIYAHISGVNSFKLNYPIQSWI